MYRRAFAAVLVLVLVGAACSSGDDDAAGGSTSTRTTATSAADGDSSSEAGTLEWEDCGEIECATLTVPLDYDDPDGETIELALARRRATGDRIGSLLVNVGGPGAAGIPVVENAPSYVGRELLERFDLVAWDPRGVGESAPVDCGDNFDYFWSVDHSPDNPDEIEDNIEASREFAQGCQERSATLLPHVSSRTTVQDMDAIRAALGEEKLTYLGFSYGTLLGALYADRYPERVRAFVLDGAVDPSLSFEQVTLDQAIGFDSALKAFLDDCARNDCGFGGSDPHRSYTLLMQAIDAEPLPAKVAGEERVLGPGEADIGVATALYAGEQGWPILADALNDAARGDGSALVRLSDFYTEREPGGSYSNSGEAFQAINCLDAPVPPPEEFPALADRVAQAAPNFGAATAWLGAPCAVWPVPPDGAPAPVRGAGAPPIVVLGTSNDPATPLKWAEGLASQLESARLVVFEGEGHTAYNRGNSCIDDAVERYLIDLEPPEHNTVC